MEDYGWSSTAYIQCVSKTSNSITVKVYGLDSGYTNTDRVVEYFKNDTSVGELISLPASCNSGGEYTIDALTPNTVYSIYAVIYGNDFGWCVYVGEQGQDSALDVTTNSDETETPNYTINYIVRTYDKVNVSITNNKGSKYFFGMFIGYELKSGKIRFRQYESIDIDGYCSDIISIEPNQNYYGGKTIYLAMEIGKVGGSGNVYFYPTRSSGSQTIGGRTFYNTGITDYEEYFTKALVLDAIFKWKWTASNGSAEKKLTNAAYTAIRNNGSTTDFSHLVWNDMVDKAYEVLSYNGASWSDNFATLDSTKMSSSDTELTATRFNSLRYNIETGSGLETGIPMVYSRNANYPVLGSYFTTLASTINGWIDAL